LVVVRLTSFIAASAVAVLGLGPGGAATGASRPLAGTAAPAPAVVAAAAVAEPSRIVLTPTTDPSTSQRISWSIARAYPGQGVSIRPVSGGAPVFVAAIRRPATSVRYSGTRNPRFTAVVTGLAPGTSYAYEVVNDRSRSAVAVFTTARVVTPADPGKWQMLAFGDTQISNRTAVRAIVAAAVAAAPGADLMLAAGDVVDKPNSDAQWRDLFTAMGASARTRNWLVSIGNHEQCVLVSRCVSGGAQAFRSYFDFPTNGYRGQGQTWFYLDYQGARIVVLDDLGGSLTAQADFLDRALASNPNPFSIVLMHASPFAARPDEPNPAVLAALEPIIEAHNVDLVLTGHDHSYARGQVRPDGPVYTISVSGPRFYPTDYSDWLGNGATPQVKAGQTATYQVIGISGNTLSYRAVVALKGPGSTTPLAVGQTLDQFTITRNADGTKVIG
jgi:hypothetical protein